MLTFVNRFTFVTTYTITSKYQLFFECDVKLKYCLDVQKFYKVVIYKLFSKINDEYYIYIPLGQYFFVDKTRENKYLSLSLSIYIYIYI